jgi:VRR-NUC domain
VSQADEIRARLARAMTEDELLQAITEAATLTGWRWTHVRRSDLGILQGHQGFPDLVLARRGRVLFLELKAHDGRLAPNQVAWLDALSGAGSGDIREVDVLVVRPSMLDDVLAELQRTDI